MIDPERDWYFENVVLPERHGTAPVGPALSWQAAWARCAEEVAAGSAAGALACRQGFVLTHPQSRAAGVSTAESRRLVRRGLWTAPRRNVLCVLPQPAPPPDEDDEPQPHGLRSEIQAAAAALVHPGHVVSHESGALMYGLPVARDPVRPLLTVAEAKGGGRPDVLIHAAALSGAEVADWFGVPVTTPARCVSDIARNSGAAAGLMAADAALREGLTTVAELIAAAERGVRWPGVRTARKVAELASPLAESPLESESRLVIHDAGLPMPELQVWVRTAAGMYRVDGLWPDRGVVLEVDGMLKYRSRKALSAEKKRQEALERAGYRVVRVTWEDIHYLRAETIDRIADALRRGGHPRVRRFTRTLGAV
jgi:very-short-patch-repair endonuclease